MLHPRFVSAHSTNPRLDQAMTEAVASLGERFGSENPDLLVAFFSGPWDESELRLPELGARLRERTGAAHLIGCTATAAIEGQVEFEGRPALALFAAALPGAQLTPFRLDVSREYGGALTFDGLPKFEDPLRAGVILLGDPFSFPMPAFLSYLGSEAPGLVVSGGMASGGNKPGSHLLLHGDGAQAEGAIGLSIEGDIELISAVSQGCRPVGEPYVVTSSDGQMVRSLRGKPAAKVMMSTIENLPDTERELFQRGAFVGLALDPTRSEFGPSDFLVRGVMGLHPQENAIALAAPEVRTGMTIQFMVRDSASASDELSRIMAAGSPHWVSNGSPTGGLLFTCNGRGHSMFPVPDHDARSIQAELGPDMPLAGLFAGGEIGMVGGRPFLHGFTASLALLRRRSNSIEVPDSY